MVHFSERIDSISQITQKESIIHLDWFTDRSNLLKTLPWGKDNQSIHLTDPKLLNWSMYDGWMDGIGWMNRSNGWIRDVLHIPTIAQYLQNPHSAGFKCRTQTDRQTDLVPIIWIHQEKVGTCGHTLFDCQEWFWYSKEWQQTLLSRQLCSALASPFYAHWSRKMSQENTQNLTVDFIIPYW